MLKGSRRVCRLEKSINSINNLRATHLTHGVEKKTPYFYYAKTLALSGASP